MTRPRLLIFAVLLCLCAMQAPLADVGSPLAIAPATTRVGLVKVILEVEALELRDNRLQGTYSIRVPMLPVLNDRGRIDLELDGPLDRTIAGSGEIRGSGHSELDGRVHPVICEFGENGQLRLIIDTGKRVLKFKSRLAG